MTNTLYEISKEITDLMTTWQDCQEDPSEEVAIDLEGKLDQLFGQFQDKVENVCKFIRNLEVSSYGLQLEIDRLQTLQRQTDNKVDRLKSYLAMIMTAQKLEKFDAGLFKLSFRKSDAVMIKDEGVIPQMYFSIKEVSTLDKNAIKEELKAGNIIPGVFLETRQNLQIK